MPPNLIPEKHIPLGDSCNTQPFTSLSCSTGSARFIIKTAKIGKQWKVEIPDYKSGQRPNHILIILTVLISPFTCLNVSRGVTFLFVSFTYFLPAFILPHGEVSTNLFRNASSPVPWPPGGHLPISAHLHSCYPTCLSVQYIRSSHCTSSTTSRTTNCTNSTAGGGGKWAHRCSRTDGLSLLPDLWNHSDQTQKWPAYLGHLRHTGSLLDLALLSDSVLRRFLQGCGAFLPQMPESHSHL